VENNLSILIAYPGKKEVCHNNVVIINPRLLASSVGKIESFGNPACSIRIRKFINFCRLESNEKSKKRKISN